MVYFVTIVLGSQTPTTKTPSESETAKTSPLILSQSGESDPVYTRGYTSNVVDHSFKSTCRVCQKKLAAIIIKVNLITPLQWIL
jgi:hypothetical protein